jgi:arabinofuranosyltransferase
LPSASPQLKALTVAVMRRRPAVRRTGRPLFPYVTMVRVSLWISVAVVAVLFGWGA